jgi:hypothetical protein
MLVLILSRTDEKGNCPMPEFKTPSKPESMEDKDKLELNT